MKTQLLSIGILLLICAQCVLSVPVKRQEEGEEEVTDEEAMAQLNEMRKNVSIALNIANTYEMVHDESYDEILDDFNCANPPQGDFVYLRAPSNETLKDMEAKKDSDPEGVKSKIMMILPFVLLHPAQYRMGCAKLDTPCNGFPFACIIGPKLASPTDGVIFGPFGSQCPDGKEDNGLCTAPFVPSPSTGGKISSALIPVTIAVLNLILICF